MSNCKWNYVADGEIPESDMHGLVIAHLIEGTDYFTYTLGSYSKEDKSFYTYSHKAKETGYYKFKLKNVYAWDKINPPIIKK